MNLNLDQIILKRLDVDENGFVLQNEKETREQFIKRLSKISTEFNKTVKATDWLNEQLNNCNIFYKYYRPYK